MVKKTVASLLGVVLTMVYVIAYAAPITLMDQSVYAREELSGTLYGSVFAEVRNDSDQPVSLSEMYDARLFDIAGNVLKEYTNSSGFPSVLQPGETGYISGEVLFFTDFEKIGPAELKLHPTQELPDTVCVRTPVTATLNLNTLEDADDEECYIFIELENLTNELYGEFNVSTAMWNQNNKIMFAYDYYVNALIPPKEKGSVRIELPFGLINAWRENGDVPTYLECFSYTTVGIER